MQKAAVVLKVLRERGNSASLEADDRASRTSQPQSRTKMR